ncbi:NADPH:quinone reductase-like Zn-dependent oxidoreductase [Lipingzhangella halophila]|uniref:NADPH:quinone reductase-like Zn-dependent oxidoreductase n=1 Tax=Lipingzhangella halophila TaxID=1783352 RepID=A0A7W7W3G3_9ACTN|nr:zinc-dependent alcohol dehydrogenase family protein [Lipingzhangella halophila]MBB4931695.1 NADPH:quinone reductase-like Zn-dependent oxidoreductase [Lipingzhangella halophila]
MARAVLLERLGGPEVLELRDVDLGEPGPGEVRISVDAIGLNRAEAWFRAGMYYVQPSFPEARIGYEAAGAVQAVGPSVEGLKTGDAVSTVPGFHLSDYGVYGDATVVPAASVLHRPDTVDTITGASLWLSYLTGYGALAEVCGVRPGDTVVVTAASSSVGLAAIQIANRLGAVPIATTRTRAKKQRLLDAGAAHVVVTEEDDLLARVQELTGGHGAEVAFDAVGGPGMNELARAVAPGGTLLSYGFQNGFPDFLPFPAFPYDLNIRIYSVLGLARDQERLRRAERFIHAGLRSGALAPVIDRVFDLTDIVEAHHHLESDTQFGKIIVTTAH